MRSGERREKNEERGEMRDEGKRGERSDEPMRENTEDTDEQ